MKNEISLPRNMQSLIDEYQAKREAIPSIIGDYEAAMNNVRIASTVGGHFGDLSLRNDFSVSAKAMEKSLLISSWRMAFEVCNIKTIGTAEDKRKFGLSLSSPPEFTFDNLLSAFGDYVANPRIHILRGVAEVFCQLSPEYRSHSKVKIGVKGLPKRIIIENVGSYSGWGRDRVTDMLIALHVYDGDGIPDMDIISDILGKKRLTWRGLRFKWHKNGNLHIHFDKDACLQINRALAEYYGPFVLPDVEPDINDENFKKYQSTSVSKDLQYYPTPSKAVQLLLGRLDISDGDHILEPSCGCGRIMDGIVDRVKPTGSRWDKDKTVHLQGIEYHAGRAKQARDKGHAVMTGNFLEQPAEPRFDIVVMNPPFYGKHYNKHLNHAMKFLKEGGRLVSILPATAHYDHEAIEFPYRWFDLPVGSFAESGVRVPTGILTAAKWTPS